MQRTSKTQQALRNEENRHGRRKDNLYKRTDSHINTKQTTFKFKQEDPSLLFARILLAHIVCVVKNFFCATNLAIVPHTQKSSLVRDMYFELLYLINMWPIPMKENEQSHIFTHLIYVLLRSCKCERVFELYVNITRRFSVVFSDEFS